MRMLVTTTSLLTLIACGSDPLGPGFESGLIHRGGCGDVILYAVDADDELMLSFHLPGAVSAAAEAGEETTTVLDLPDASVELVLEQGTRISDAMCDDVIEQGGPQVAFTWTATAGRATLRIRPDVQGTARADLLLEDVVLESDGGATVRLQHLEWENVGVGWYPG